MHAALEQAIEDLYAVFARYPLRARIDGCPHCGLEARERALHSAALRELPEEHVGYFAFKAMTTFGDEDDFRHFLPRIAELVTERAFVHACGLGTIVGKLEYGCWRTWPEAEQRAIERWIDALWTSFEVDRGYRGPFSRELLGAASVVGIELHACLSRWARARSPCAVEELASLVLVTSAASNHGGIAYPDEPWGAELDRWVRTDPEVRRTLESELASSPDPDRYVESAVSMLAFPPFSA